MNTSRLNAGRPGVSDPEQPNHPVEPDVPYQPTEPDEPDVQEPITVQSDDESAKPEIEHSNAGNEALEKSSMHLKIVKPEKKLPDQPQSITGADELPDDARTAKKEGVTRLTTSKRTYH